MFGPVSVRFCSADHLSPIFKLKSCHGKIFQPSSSPPAGTVSSAECLSKGIKGSCCTKVKWHFTKVCHVQTTGSVVRLSKNNKNMPLTAHVQYYHQFSVQQHSFGADLYLTYKDDIITLPHLPHYPACMCRCADHVQIQSFMLDMSAEFL